MPQAQKSFLFWTPRVFSILFILFVVNLIADRITNRHWAHLAGRFGSIARKFAVRRKTRRRRLNSA